MMRIWETRIDSARRMWQAAATRRRLQARVEALFDEGLQADAVMTRLQEDPALDPADRERAVRLAQTRDIRGELLRNRARSADRSRATALQTGSWMITVNPGHGRSTYEDAHRQIEEALRLVPDERRHWNTLGVVLYRLGRYADALEAFAEAERINPLSPAPYHAAHYRVWQAPCYYFLGEEQRARELLVEARAAPANVRKSLNAFLVEAASVIEAADPTPP